MLVSFYTSRNPLIVDDVTPVSSCDNLIEKADLLFVILNYQNHPLDSYPEWCEKMRMLNKTTGMHGITHQYHEFDKPVEKEELEEAVTIFENCFGYKPVIFRPPYNKISPENKALIESFSITVYRDTFFLHPYCHCEPQGWMKLLNWMIGC